MGTISSYACAIFILALYGAAVIGATWLLGKIVRLFGLVKTRKKDGFYKVVMNGACALAVMVFIIFFLVQITEMAMFLQR